MNSCGFDADWKFPEVGPETRNTVIKSVTSYLENHPDDVGVTSVGDGRLFCEVGLLDVRDKGQVAYGRAVCQVYSRELVDGEGLGTPFRASLNDGREVVAMDVPEGIVPSDPDDKIIPDDLKDDMCQIGFAGGEDPSVRDERMRGRASSYFGADDE